MTRQFLLVEPGRGSMSRAACSIGGKEFPPAARELMADSAAHHGLSAGVMSLSWETDGVLPGITLPFPMQEGKWRGLPGNIVSEAAFLYLIACVCSDLCSEAYACGYKNGSSGTADTNVGKNCNYWSKSAMPSDGTKAFNWNVNSGNLNENTNAKTNGFSVRMFRMGICRRQWELFGRLGIKSYLG